MTKTLSWAATDVARPLSAALLQFAATTLEAASAVLAHLATRLHAAETRRAAPEPAGWVEFHAIHGEAGAPEGALYVDGKLVGVIAGVHRL